MINRNKLLKVFGADPKAWARKHELEPFSHTCSCGAELETSIPFACGKARGLIAPQCGCGAKPPYCVTLGLFDATF